MLRHVGEWLSERTFNRFDVLALAILPLLWPSMGWGVVIVYLACSYASIVLESVRW